ncbi:MAG TPA: nitroreductase family protein [Firmicutes bacterium]|nr:nitroreductase family protein [Bacillota bacterium]
MNAIFNRKSIRKYTEQVVTNEQVELVLRAAMAAPSAGNAQPWDFIVVRDQNKINEMIQTSPYTGPLKTASVAVVVCGDTAKERFSGYWVQDCSAAIENMLIQAEDMGLGAVWMGIYPIEERVAALKQIFNLPETVTPLAVVPLGYPAEQKQAVDRFNESRVHFETWNNLEI